ncbi:MAG: DUF5615 family PIN-like protein [Gemmatimonadota bacterium]|jgi:hypothetical protein
MAALRFLLDEGIHPRVAELGWEEGMDVVSVHELRRRGLSDYEQLRLAANEDRVLVTRNRVDYLYWTAEFYRSNMEHCGVLFVPEGFPNDQPERIMRTLKRWHYAHSQDDDVFGPYHVDFLAR